MVRTVGNQSQRGKSMLVRKRIWKTAKGVEKEAWVVDYVSKVGGKRRLRTFAKKKDANCVLSDGERRGPRGGPHRR